METSDPVTLLDRFVMAALPTMLNINNGDIPDAVADAYETGLELMRRREEYQRKATALLNVSPEQEASGGEPRP
ncbi:MAG TPA: hypothetical protein VGD78_14690 [Chthoniobacterales bacterium]